MCVILDQMDIPHIKNKLKVIAPLYTIAMRDPVCKIAMVTVMSNIWPWKLIPNLLLFYV